ncbi:MAG: diphthamide synthesis protein [Nanoarchaeota archaeon]
MEINLELQKIISIIEKNKYKKICIQLPDGLKPKSKMIHDYLKKETNAEIFIWGGSCFGGCDIPNIPKFLKIDLFIQFGHTKFIK